MKNSKTSLSTEQRMKWYLDAKFGLFIHWGAYSVAGAEASWPIMAPKLSEAMFRTPSTISEKDYEILLDSFNPVDFNADEWVKIAKDAGVKYIVITSKHHDGFCMFDAPNTTYKITNTPFGRDVCKELSIACQKQDMTLGFYYSPPDMNHPGYRDTTKPMVKTWLGQPKRKEWDEYLDYMESHLRKLLTDYGDIAVIWFDGLCNHAKYDTKRFHNLIHELSPKTLINDRLGDDYDFVTPEQFIPTKGIPIKSGKPPSGDSKESENFFKIVITLFKVPLLKNWIKKQMEKYSEGTLELAPVSQESYPSSKRYQPWETCMTIGNTWAYNPNETNWKTPKTLVQNLSTVVGHGGNYLLNVGPTDKGVFPEEAKKRLKHIGKWMENNHEAIYGTTYTPINSESWGTTTLKDDSLYLHVTTKPTNNILLIDNFPFEASAVSLLQNDKLAYSQNHSQLEITLPKAFENDDVTIVKVTIEDKKNKLEAFSTYQPLGKTPKKYILSNAYWSAGINGVINGLLALATYKLVANVPALDAGIDALISVGIIVFLTSWLIVSGTRKDIPAGKIALEEYFTPYKDYKLNQLICALIIMVIAIITLGGLLNAFVYLLFPSGFSGFGYIIFKTLYTASAGALAVVISIKSVFKKNKIS